MKKRLSVFIIVFCFVFTGSFGVFSSATSQGNSFVQRLIEVAESFIPTVDIVTSDDLKEVIHEYYRSRKLKATSSHSSSPSWKASGALFYQSSEAALTFDNNYPVHYSAYIEFICRYYDITLPSNYRFVIWADPNNNDSVTLWLFYNYTESYPIYDTAYRDTQLAVSCAYSGGYHSCTAISATFTRSYDSNLDVYHVYLANRSKIPNCTQTFTTSNSVCGFENFATNFVEEELSFSSEITVTGSGDNQQLNITLDSNRVVNHDLFAFAGILYDDGSQRYDGTDCGFINADYVDAKSLQGGTHWEWTFDLDAFSEWAYRKHIFSLPNFYGFVDVHEGGSNNHFINVLYSDDEPLNLSDPTGIFEDVQPMPDPDDYKPTPSPFPAFPDVSFDYSPTNNYTTYNYDTVNNYDSTTQNFNDWLGDTITTINNNISGGIDNIDHNIKTTGDNIKNFTEEFKNYIEGSSADISEYLGDLIKKFNNDFLDWTDSYSDYLGDLFQTLNDNITIIGDNIVNAIKIQAIPDKENVIDICKTNFPLYDDFSTLFDEHDVSNSDLIVAIPYLSNDNANGIELVTRELNAAASDGPEDISRELNSDFDPVMTPYLEGYYVFNISALLRSEQYQFSRFRTVATLIILGSTFFALFNITLKCFGMHFGSLSSDDPEPEHFTIGFRS